MEERVTFLAVACGGAVIVAMFGLKLISWLGQPRFSKKEKEFALYVQEEARKNNLIKGDIEQFLSINWEMLTFLYSSQYGLLIIEDASALRGYIIETY